jgi:hypothetical protein
MEPSPDLGLLVLAAFYHPDVPMRAHIKAAIEAEMVTDSGWDEDRVCAFLRAQPGTPVEPFCLDGIHLNAAALVLRLALAHRVSRFRIVSQETIGNRGGLVVTCNLKGYYTERYVLGKRTGGAPLMDRFAAPAMMRQSLGDMLGQKPRVKCRVDDEGYYLEMGNPGWQDTDRASSELGYLQANSEVYGKEKLLDRLGMKFTYRLKNICLRPTSPESMIQFTALMYQGAILRLAFTDQTLFVRLAPQVDSSTPLSAVITQRSRAMDDWIAVPFAADIALSDDVYRSIARWAQPHASWVHPSFVASLI